MSRRNFRKRLLSCICVMVSAAIACSSGHAANAGSLGEDVISEVNWAQNRPYEIEAGWMHNQKNDPNATKLTDGVLTQEWDQDDNLLAFKGSAAFTFDLGQTRSVDRVSISAYEKIPYGIGLPSAVSVEYYDDATASWIQSDSLSPQSPFTGVYDDGYGVGYGPVRIESSIPFNSSKVRVYLEQANDWMAIDEVEIYGSSAVELPVAPTIVKDLEEQKTVSRGETVSLEILAETADGGELSYQWYHNDTLIESATEAVYTIVEAQPSDSGLYKVVVTNTKNGATASIDSSFCYLKVAFERPDSLLSGIPFTTSMQMGNPNAPGGTQGNYIDNDENHPSAYLLTNGIRQQDGDIMGVEVGRYNKFYNSLTYADFIFDLGSVQSFAQLNLSTLAHSAGISPPTKLEIYMADEKKNTAEEMDWVLIFDGKLADEGAFKEYVIATTDEAKATARYLKLHIFFDSDPYDLPWIAIDEISLYHEKTGETPDGIMGEVGELPESLDNMLSLGCRYTSNPVSADDPEQKRLTDGLFNNAIKANRVYYPPSGGNAEIVLDLQRTVSFEQVDTNFFSEPENDIWLPKWVRVEYSEDQKNWTLLEEKTLGEMNPTQETVYRYKGVLSQSAQARYIKLTVPNDGEICFDEISVLKDRTVVNSEEESEPDDPNNLARGCSYATAWPFHPSYPDDGKLTDGRRAPAEFSSPDWTGFHIDGGGSASRDPFYVTIDLGADRSFEQVKFGALTQMGIGIYAPVSANVQYSPDGEIWHEWIERQNPSHEYDGVSRFCFETDSSISARYIRIGFQFYRNWLFLDEIEVLEKKDESDIETPDDGKILNLIRGNENYQVSREPDINPILGLLTDGKYGVTYTPYDRNWMGFQNNSGQPEHIQIDFELYLPASVSQIVCSSRQDAERGQLLPKNLKLSVSSDKANWHVLKTFSGDGNASGQLIWDGEETPISFNGEDYPSVYTRYIRMEFDIPAGEGFVYLDEVKIMGKLGRCAQTVTLTEKVTGAYNVAFGKPYKIVPLEMPSNIYSDNSWHKLTDGVTGSCSFTDSAWTALRYRHYGDIRALWPMGSIVIDLQDVKTIESFTCNLLSVDHAGIKPPRSIHFFASMDGETWVPLARNSILNQWKEDAIHTIGWHNEILREDEGPCFDLAPDLDAIAARYVRVDFELTDWHFIDEITVIGTDGRAEGSTAADYGSKLEKGGNFLRAGEKTGGVQDMILCYNGWYGVDNESNQLIGDWTSHKYRPLLTYIDQENNAVDTMFDTILLLGLQSRYGRSLVPLSGVDDGNANDWLWYLEKTFGENGDVAELNRAAEQAAKELGNPNYKANLVIMCPTPIESVSNFGQLGDSRPLNMTLQEDRNFAVDWWIQQVLSEMKKGNYSYIDFKGFYWMDESASQEETIIHFNQIAHANGLKTFWIPHFGAVGQFYADDLGFDGVTYQPHHFFDSPFADFGWGQLLQRYDNPLMDNFVSRISFANIGPEFEVEGSALEDVHKYNQYLDYLNTAVESGYDGPGFHRSYYNATPIVMSAYSGDSLVRTVYEYTYQMMRGTYPYRTYVEADDFPADPDYGGLLRQEGLPSYRPSEGGLSGGSVTPKPDDKPAPETPPTGDENYTWEETEEGYKLTDKDGEIATGWAKVDGKWYYLDDNGIRQTGWQKVDNKWYYLKEDGVMATGWLKLGNVWYFLNGGGVMQTGWLYNGGVWYYLYDWGGMTNSGWIQVGNTWYYMRGNGAMATGWLQQGRTWYYLKDSGAMTTGWNWVGSKCYYFYESGKMAVNTTVDRYKIGTDGAWKK